MEDAFEAESFEDFRRSFSYGSRNDLNFKFLKSASDVEAAEFFRLLLDELGDAYDTGDFEPLVQTAIAAQKAGYTPASDAPQGPNTYDTGPFTPTSMPINASTVGLITSSGHFAHGDDPEPFGVKDMTQDEAVERISEFLREAPVLSVVETSIAPHTLRVRHGGYDITSAEHDHNVAFPVGRLVEAAADGRIGSVTDNVFSFPGATAQGRLRKQLPGWITLIETEQPDAVVLVPL